ncbi:MAG: carbon-nitrogen hydrolase family protein [Nocardioidaceae bacterium]
MRTALVQCASSLDPGENRAHLASLVPAGADLVVLPEAYARDFGAPGSAVDEFAEPLDGPFVSALVAAAGDSTVVAGMFEVSDDPARPYNTLVAVNRDGLVASYRKIHLYDSFGNRESDRLSAGSVEQRPIFDLGDVRVALATCYDLRFPELFRGLCVATDLVVLPAAWVAGPRKVRHWQTLLVARAIENVCYVAGAGQSPPRYSGHSMLVDPRGDVVASVTEDTGVALGEVDPDLVATARRENPSLDNRRL